MTSMDIAKEAMQWRWRSLGLVFEEQLAFWRYFCKPRSLLKRRGRLHARQYIHRLLGWEFRNLGVQCKLGYTVHRPYIRAISIFIHSFAMFFCVSCEGLLGQYVAIVEAHQPGELPKSSPCEWLDKMRCTQLAKKTVRCWSRANPDMCDAGSTSRTSSMASWVHSPNWERLKVNYVSDLSLHPTLTVPTFWSIVY